jgi:hypothetical protein
MPRRRHIAVAVFVGGFLILLGLSWFWGRLEATRHTLRFESANGPIRPLFVFTTRGRLETNYSPAPGLNLGRVYVHRLYFASPKSVEPISAFRYRLGKRVAPVLGRLVAWDKFCWHEVTTPTDTLLCLGYRATNSIIDFDSDAVLVSDRGLRLPLTPALLLESNARREHLDCWQLPALITNRGKYILTMPKSNQPLVTFVYDRSTEA